MSKRKEIRYEINLYHDEAEELCNILGKMLRK